MGLFTLCTCARFPNARSIACSSQQEIWDQIYSSWSCTPDLHCSDLAHMHIYLFWMLQRLLCHPISSTSMDFLRILLLILRLFQNLVIEVSNSIYDFNFRTNSFEIEHLFHMLKMVCAKVSAVFVTGIIYKQLFFPGIDRTTFYGQCNNCTAKYSFDQN